jgi:hypothetical protein
MLVPVSGGVAALQKRNRSFPVQSAMLKTIDIPSVFIFNVGLDPWRGVGGGREWKIPAKPKNGRYSDPVEVPMLNLSEIDLADGGNNMGVVTDRALGGTVEIGGDLKHVSGVVDDILGTASSSADLSLYTTNGKWKGVFWSMSEIPSEEEIAAAEENFHEYMLLVYSEGKQRVEQNMKESENASLRMQERKMFNRAANYLGYQALYGEGEIRRGACPECKSSVNDGANFCPTCNLPIDPASVAARAKKRERENAKLLKEDESGQEMGE